MAHIEQSGGQIRSFIGPEAVNIMRMRTILGGMKLERSGLRLTRGILQSTRVRREYGLKGNRESLIEQFEVLLREAEAKITVVNLDEEDEFHPEGGH